MSKKNNKNQKVEEHVQENGIPAPLPFKNIFQKENFYSEKDLKWYRKTWVIITFLFTPLFFVGIYLLLTQKYYTWLFKGMVLFFFFVAILTTVLQMNGIDIMEKMPFYTSPYEDKK